VWKRSAEHRLGLHDLHDDVARPHETLTKAANGYLTTPAMADHVWTLVEIAALPD